MSKEERGVLQAFVDQAHRQFVTAIAEARKMDIEHVKSLADGRIYTGEHLLARLKASYQAAAKSKSKTR